MKQETLRALLQAVAQSVIGHAEELTALDQAIGDGDHGLNMKRGFERVAQSADEISQQPLPQALTEVGDVERGTRRRIALGEDRGRRRGRSDQKHGRTNASAVKQEENDKCRPRLPWEALA